MLRMGALRARVTGGRLVLDIPTTLPEGTEVDLVVDDGGDDLDEDERAQLRQAIERGLEDARAGRTRPIEELLNELDRDQE